MDYDVGHCLSEFISSIDNLPAELSYHLAELKAKEIKYQELRRAISRRESLLASYIKEHGLQNSQQYENIMNAKTKRDFAQARQLADEKIALSEQTLELLERHIKRLDVDLGRLTSEMHGDMGEFATPRRENHGYVEVDDLDSNGLLGRPAISRSRLKGRQKKSQKAVLRDDRVIVRKDDEIKIAEEAVDVDGGEVDDALYCFCRQVSFGDMVACDGNDCTYEWFHWECVGLTEEPAGAWYCSECLEKRKRQKLS